MSGTTLSMALTSSAGIKKLRDRPTVQMMKSLTLLGNFAKGFYSRIANIKVGVLQCIDDVWHHALNHLDEFRWKK